jgi:hypothetical protein
MASLEERLPDEFDWEMHSQHWDLERSRQVRYQVPLCRVVQVRGPSDTER